MRRLLTLNVLDAFVIGAYMMAVPLLLIERNIELTTIGVVFSILPLVYMTRILFASAADSIGYGRFFRMSTVANLASVVLYGLSSSSVMYSLAKGAEGVRDASLWAVNRNAAYEIAGSSSPHTVVTISFVRALALAIGAIVSGFLLSWLGFQGIFIMLAILSALSFIPARMLTVGPRSKLVLNEVLRKLDPSLVRPGIWEISLILSSYMAASALITGFILPIFLQSRGFGYWEIGIILAIYNLVGAFLLPLTLHRTPSIRNTVIAQAMLYLPAAILVPLLTSWIMTLMLVMMALGENISYIVLESLISRAAAGHENVATTIAFAFVPGNLARMAAYAFAGVLAEKLGYIGPFWAAGAFFAIYSISAWRILKQRQKY